MDSFKIIIHNKEADKYFAPAVLDGAELSLELTGTPGKLVFSAHKDEILDMYSKRNATENNTSRLRRTINCDTLKIRTVSRTRAKKQAN